MRRSASCSAPLLFILGLLSACASGGSRPGDYVGGYVSLECAPFARALSGIRLSGAAADWWWQAEGSYGRTGSPIGRQRARAPPFQPPAERPCRRRVAGNGQAPDTGDPGELGAPPRQRGPAGDRRLACKRLVDGARLVAADRRDGRHRVSRLWLHPNRSADVTRPAHRGDATGDPRGGARLMSQIRRSGGVFATVTHLHVGQLRVVRAVWFTWFRGVVAEPETPRAWLAERPAAGDDAAIRTRRRWRHPGWRRHRDRPRRQDRHVRTSTAHRRKQRLTRVLDSGGSVGPATRRGADRLGAPPPEPSRRIGDGRAGRSSRCALPTTAFFETPNRRPISAVDSPSSQSVRNRTIVSSAHSISWFPRRCNHKIR